MLICTIFSLSNKLSLLVKCKDTYFGLANSIYFEQKWRARSKVWEMKHIAFCLTGCNSDLINDEPFVVTSLQEAARRAGATLLKTASCKFEPQGVTALALLAESHISLHSWPEENKAYCDVFTCGEHTDPQKGLDYMKECFEATSVENMRWISRN